MTKIGTKRFLKNGKGLLELFKEKTAVVTSHFVIFCCSQNAANQFYSADLECYTSYKVKHVFFFSI